MAAGGNSWQIVQLASASLWLPTSAPPDLVVQCADLRVVRPDDGAWQPGALVPAGPWRPLADAARAGEDALGPFRTECDIAVVAVPADGSRAPAARRLATLGQVERFLGVGRDVPGMATLTRDPGPGVLLGLHLDNWDRLPAGVRHLSRNRASLNLGPDARSLLFVDLSILRGFSADAIPDTDSARRLVQDAAEMPSLLRVQVPTGYAYIAPTENLLHDASSIGQHQGAFHVSALGRFRPDSAP